jgi:hypothetical protein
MSNNERNQRTIAALSTSREQDASIDQWFATYRADQQRRDLKEANRIKVQADEAFDAALANGADLDD